MTDDNPYFKAMATLLRKLLSQDMPYVKHATLTVIFDEDGDEHELTLSAHADGEEMGN